MVTWTSMNPAVATISGGGLAKGLSPGSATIEASAGSINGMAVLQVTDATLVSIPVTPANPSIAKGLTQQFTATGTFSDNSTQNLTASATWSSLTTSVATITAGGLATGVGTGSAAIHAVSGSITGSTTLTVTAAALVSISVTPMNPTIGLAQTEQFTATGTYTDNSMENLTTSVAWNSTKQTFATISNTAGSNGLATAVAAGSTTIQATLGAVQGSTTLFVSTATQLNVTTSQYNNQRTSVNSNETILTPSNVNQTDFGKLFSQPVDGYVYAQPLYVANLTINGAVHNVVYVATEHDSVYAFDADSNSGANAQPLWHTTFLSSGVTTVSSSVLGCSDINPEYGVTGTPVIDPSTNIMYAVAETLENGGTNYVKRLHALNILTGAEMPGSPTVISASVTVIGQSAVTFNAQWENQRPGLLLYNGVVYIGFSSHCDNDVWQGWILGYSYNGSSFSQPFVFSTEPSSVNGRQAGVWMSGQGLAMDTGSNLFVATGNGQFDTTITPPINYGDSIIRIDLSQGPKVQDYFTPSDEATLDGSDGDLGSGGIAMLFNQPGPDPDLLVQAGKAGTIFVVNRDNMSHYSASGDNVVQEIGGIGGMYSSPVYFDGKVYFWAVSDVVRAFTVTNGMLSTSPTDEGSKAFGFPGATPTISANGTSNAILWAIESDQFSDSGPGGAAVLYAYSASNLSAGPIYSSSQNSTRDNPGGAIKFAVATVDNGKVYVGAEGQLSVYGLLP